MTDTNMTDRPPLGVGAILSETFATYFKRFPTIFFLGLVVYGVVGIVNGLVLGFSALSPEWTELEDPGAWGIGLFIMMILGFLAYGLLTSVVVLLAYDARLGRPVRLSGYLGAALPVMDVVSVLMLIVWFLLALGLVALVVPGLWVMGAFSVIIPAAVIERAGFGSLGRSLALTRGYRWPIIGALVVAGLIYIILGGALNSIVMALLFFGSDGSATVSGIIYTASNTIASAIAYGFPAILAAVIYARLREIKDGVGVASLADIFR